MATRGDRRELVIRKGVTPNSGQLPGEEIFDNVLLNNLEVSGFPELCDLSKKIAKINNLLQLVLKGNGLKSLPSEIGALKLLKHLDLSYNTLSSIPVELYQLQALQTLVLSNNKLVQVSFPDVPTKDLLPHLHYLDISNNQLEELPTFLFNCSQLSELLASNNSLKHLSFEIGHISQLKTLDLNKNLISELPQDLSNCTKLRSLLLTNNPIADRRLLKLIDQHGTTKPRTVLDYVRSHGSSSQPSQVSSVKTEPKSKKKGKKSAAGKKIEADKGDAQDGDNNDDDDDVVVFGAKYCIRVTKPAGILEVQAMQSARAVRQYIVCCVIKNVDLASPGNFKKFINIQTKLHDGVCRKRKLCTIATHDLSLVQLPLLYTAGVAEDIRLTPLGVSDALTVKDFVSLLEANKPAATRGGAKSRPSDKPSNPTASSLSKYLELINIAEKFPYLTDAADRVISLPPLTNCECSKITPNTTNVLVEVTSSRSLQACKTALDSLVLEMLHAGVDCVTTEQSSVGHEIHLEQSRVVDETGTLLVAYPSRPDLAYNDDDVEVKREL